MKKNILFAAVMSAVMTVSAMGTVPAYAVKEDTAVSETETGFEFTEGKKFKSPVKGSAALVSGGVIYSTGCEEGVFTVCASDKNGRTLHRLDIDPVTDKNGDRCGVSESKLKRYGDYLYLTYKTGALDYFSMSVKDRGILKLDMELNKVAEYKVPRCACFDTNGEQVAYMKKGGGKDVYVMNMDGSDKRKIYTAGENDDVGWINWIEVTDKYIGFNGGKNSDDTGLYCGYINIETGESDAVFKKHIAGFSENGNRLVWSTSGLSAKNNTIYIFDGEKISALKLENTWEHPVSVGGGDVITTAYDADGESMYIHIYRNGKLAGKYRMPNDKVSVSAGDGMIIASEYIYAPGTDLGWHSVSEGDKIIPAEFTVEMQVIEYKLN